MQKNFINKLSAFCVLYVEDENGIRSNIEEILKHLFKEVLSATDVNEAYNKYLQNKPDLIITDIKMKDKTGIELLKKRFQRPFEVRVSVKLVSAYRKANRSRRCPGLHDFRKL